MDTTMGCPDGYDAEASTNATPGELPSDGRSIPHQGSSWIAGTFVNGISAAMDLCADRSGFIKRLDIVDHIPDHIKERIMHPSPESQIRGFEDLFTQLNTPGAEDLRRLVTTYFYDSLPLRSHLRHQPNRASESVPSVRRLNSTLVSLNVQAAAFDSYENARRESCFKGTRAMLLADIESWMKTDSGRQSIYVLYGVAGIGKSTVSKTVAERAAELEILGASFFFSRDEEARKTAKSFFPTLACQLARNDENITQSVNEALEKDPDALGRDLRKQFRLLIAEPLRLPASSIKPTLIVIDALDECEDDVETILSLLVQEIPAIPRLKILITARPERHIRNALARYNNHEQLCLHHIEELVVESDIRLYLDSHLCGEAVQKALPELLPPPWQPTEEQKKILVGMSGKLFIIASTTAAFILDAKRLAPAKQLAILINGVSRADFSRSERTTVMDGVYMQILRAARPDPVGDWIEEYQTFVGTIVLLREPLPLEALAGLLGVEENSIIGTLSNLHSLLAPSGKGRTFRIHHMTFPDFITNRNRCEAELDFHIDPRVRHSQIARYCLHTMDRSLKFNICCLERGDWHQDRLDLHNHAHYYISRHLSYACTHWASHLVSGLGDDAEFDEEVTLLLERFAAEHLLTWLEVLSAIGRMDSAYPSLNAVSAIMERAQNYMISEAAREIFYDGCRFILRNVENLKLSPMHIYYSALPFTPTGTALFRTYKGRFPYVLEVITNTENTWTPLIGVLRGHSGFVLSVAFSADSSRLASASDDCTVQLWDTQTGAHIATLEGHTDSVRSVRFSADGSRLASASDDRTVRLWDGKTGVHMATFGDDSRRDARYDRLTTCMTFSLDGSRLASGYSSREVQLWDSRAGTLIAVLKGHSRMVNSVIFSPDGSRAATASRDKTARLWDGKTGTHIAVLEGHSGSVNTVIFSPDGSKLASASRDHTVRLWSSETGACIATLMNDDPERLVYVSVFSTSFSPDGSRLASVSGDTRIHLWDTNTFRLTATLDGHSFPVNSVTFSPDGSRLASASDDETVRLWDGETGAHITTLIGHSDSINSVVFSKDGLRIASASRDRTVRLWDCKASMHATAVQHHSRSITSIMFSPDGSRLASSSNDNTLRLWDGKTGVHLAVLEGHSDFVKSAAFSPDGSRLVSVSRDPDETGRWWDGKTGHYIGDLAGGFHPDFVIFSPDGSRIAFGSWNEPGQLKDGRTGDHIATLNSRTMCRASAAFSADSSRLALTSLYHRTWTELYDGKIGTHIATLKGHSCPGLSVAFSVDGSILASTSPDKTVRLWDGNTGAHITTLETHSRDVTGVVFSPDGLRLASFSSDATVLVWDCATSTILGTFKYYIALHHNPHSLTHANPTFLLGKRKDSNLYGLLALMFHDDGHFDLSPVCWLPPNMGTPVLAANPSATSIAFGCKDGRLVLIDISKALFP